MSNDRRDDNLLKELDSLKGLLDTQGADVSDDDLHLNAARDSDDSGDEEPLPEAFLRGWDEEEPTAEEDFTFSTAPAGEEAIADDEDVIPEEFLIDVETATPDAGEAVSERTSPSREDPPSDPDAIAAEVSAMNETPIPEAAPEIPLLEEEVTLEEAQQAQPDAFGATSWEELETIVDLLLERRLDHMRAHLRDELLTELERQTGWARPGTG